MKKELWLALSYLACSKPSILGKIISESPIQALNAFKNDEIDKACEQSAKELEGSPYKVLTQEDECFPKELFDLEDPPACIFVLGEVPLGIKLGMVGTRKASPQGLGIARNFATDIASAGVTIVSGMADGIDQASHTGALDACGQTISVLGFGFAQAKSSQQRHLVKLISDRGAVISEFPPNFPGDRWTFPFRNRIIAALSKAVLVVEAPKKSGALITANFAAQLGRHVLACPGLPFMESYKGSNDLIKNGAFLADSPNDVLEVLGVKSYLEEPNVSDIELSVLTVCKEPTTMDIICESTSLAAPVVMSVLTVLDMRGLIIKLPGGMYLRKSAKKAIR